MAKKQIKLEQIRIASPCPTSWESMIGDDLVRFCNVCTKKVYNLSSMTKVQAEEILNETQGRLCGMIYTRKDGSIMTADCPVGLATIRRRLAKRLAAVAAMIITLFSGALFFVRQKPLENHSHAITTKVQSHQNEVTDQVTVETLGSLGYIQ